VVAEVPAFKGRVRGTHLLNVIEYVKRKRGVQGVKRLMEMANTGRPKGARLSPGDVSEKELYSYATYILLLEGADLVCGTGDMGRAYDIGHQTIQHLGHLDYLARAPDIHAFIRNAVRNWRAVYDFGELKLVRDEPRRLVVRYYGFPRATAKCNYFKGSLAGMMTLCRLHGTVKETACNTLAADYCEFTLEWE
jgi:hypothetical protein